MTTIANLATARPGESPLQLYRRLARAADGQTLEMTLWQDVQQRWLEEGWPEPHPQVQFHADRRWRFDLAYFQPYLLAIEIDGGVWGRRNPRTGEWERGKPGGHTTGAGYQAACEKQNEATIAGWRLLRVTGDDVRSGAALEYIRRALKLPTATATTTVSAG